MKWSKIFERHGYQLEETGVDPDPFFYLAQEAQNEGKIPATVTYRTALDFGKVACTVTIQCPQDERSINLAGEIAFRKAVELTNDGASITGELPLQGPSE